MFRLAASPAGFATPCGSSPRVPRSTVVTPAASPEKPLTSQFTGTSRWFSRLSFCAGVPTSTGTVAGSRASSSASLVP